MRVRTIIVDDEQPICDDIEYLLKKEADIVVTAKFTNALDVLAYIGENKCDLVFLDIKMPGASGLEIASRIARLRRPPLIVFITAFQDHALEAFETLAVGYITKPVTEIKIARVLEKIRAIFERSARQDPVSVSKICVTSGGKIIPLDKQDIIFAYVRDKDVFIRTKTEEFTATLTMQEIENFLNDDKFFRVHRQYLVNLDRIKEIIPWFHGSYLLRMDDFKAEKVPVSRNKIKTLKAIIGLK